MEERFLSDASNEAQTRIEDIRREIRFFNTDLNQLGEMQDDLSERKQHSSDKGTDEKDEKVRDSQNAIKLIQILINDFKSDYRGWESWDEFKRSERQFNELVDEFHI